MKKYLLLFLFLSFNSYATNFKITLNKTKIELPKNPIISLANINGAVQWKDGSYSDSCLNYLNPPQGKVYQGVTGDGVYRIKTDTGVVEEVNCDMSNGGWTQIFGSNIPQIVITASNENYSGTIVNTKSSIGLQDNLSVCDMTRHNIILSDNGIPHSQVNFKNVNWTGYGQPGSDFCLSTASGLVSDGPLFSNESNSLLYNQTINIVNGGSFVLNKIVNENINNLQLGCSCSTGYNQRGVLNSGQIWIK